MSNLKPQASSPKPASDQKLKHIGPRDRLTIKLATAANRRRRAWYQAEQDARVGPGRCSHCGREPCALMWPSAKCCDKCSHEALPEFQPTHVLWYAKSPFFVREVPLGKDASLYQRADGVVWFTRQGTSHFFLGQPLRLAEFARFRVGDPEGDPAADANGLDEEEVTELGGEGDEDDAEEDDAEEDDAEEDEDDEDEDEEDAEDAGEDEDDADADEAAQEGEQDESEEAPGEDPADSGHDDAADEAPTARRWRRRNA